VYASSAISANNILYIVNASGRVYAFDLNTLNPSSITPKWTHAINDPVSSSPALDLDHNLYITTEAGRIVKLQDNGNSVTSIWDINTSQKYTSSPIIASDSTLYIGGEANILYAINTLNGNIIWQDSLSGKIKSTATLAEKGIEQDRLYVGDNAGKLYAIKLSDGDIIWQYQANAAISCPILYANDYVYFGTMGGDIISIEDKFESEILAKRSSDVITSVWPTFQGNNRRTGNQVDLNTSVIDIPKVFTLKQNYPNPFNPLTKIEYSLPTSSRIRLTIFDISGRSIKQWNISSQQPGWHEVIWDGTDISGNVVSTGVYIYSLQAGDFVDTKKMVFMK
jgi:outer membrane protein assembly factor BamB